jgi:phenylalanyl-tRNA synthetase beta chain
MGGANSEVSMGTTQILLEAAYFAPASVRKSAKAHGLHTEASHRFERGCDPDAVMYALDRAAALMVELCPDAQILRGVVDVLPSPLPVVEVSLRLTRLLALSGLPASLVDEVKVTQCLSSIGLEVSGRDGEAIRFRIPSFRPDLRREVDLIEEVVRLVGYDKVPTSLPAPSGPAPSFIPEEELKVEYVAHDVLQGKGFSEAVNFAFGPEHIFKFFVSQKSSLIRIENPLGEEMAFMRPSLIPGLLGNLAHNIRHGERNVRLYEMANTFHGKNPQGHSPSPKSTSGPSGADAWANETPFLGGLWSGSKAPVGFDRAEQEVDYYDLKGVVASYLKDVKLDASRCSISFEAAEDSVAYLHPKSATHIFMNVGNEKIRCGVVGETHPALMEALDISEKAFVFELDLQKIALKTTQVVKALPLPKFPSVKRDFALLMEDAVPAGALIEAIQSNEGMRGLLEDVEIFDVYRGSHLPENKKSIAVSILLRAADRTLTDSEVQNGTDLLLKSLSESLGAEIR